jgi:hypothetical protein
MTSLAGKASTKGIAAEKKEMLQECMAIIRMTKKPETQQIAQAVFVSMILLQKRLNINQHKRRVS